jgi:hypothetical protein
MNRSLSSLIFTMFVGACINNADAQTRRRSRPQRPTTVVSPTPAPAPVAAVSPAETPGPRDPRNVVAMVRGRWSPRCIASRGCVARPAYPACPQPGPNVRLAQRITVADAFAQRLTLSGQLVSIQGKLGAFPGCTEMACSEGTCCNGCFGAIALTARGTISREMFSLAASERDPRWSCQGDDSGVCCAAEVPAGEVLVTGTLRAVPNSGGSWRIEEPNVCVL